MDRAQDYEWVGTKSVVIVQSLFVCHWLLTVGTVILVSLIAVLPTILEKFYFTDVSLLHLFPLGYGHSLCTTKSLN